MRDTIIVLVLIGVLFCGASLHAQETGIVTRQRFGLFGDASYNLHQGSFRALPGIPCCSPLSAMGSGLDFSAGLLYEFPLEGGLSLSFTGEYWGENGNFSTNETKTVNLNGEAASQVIRHTMRVRLGIFGLESLLGYNLVDRFSLHAGPQIGAILMNSYRQRANIIQPFGGRFENGQRFLLESRGAIPETATFFTSLVMGGSYEIPLNRRGTWLLTPEVLFSLGLSNVVKDSSWKVNSIRAGVSLKYSPPPGNVKHADNSEPLLVANVVATGVEGDGTEVPDVRLHVEEFTSTQMHPLLNAVFFAENSDEIPARYVNMSPAQTDGFKLDQFHDVNDLDMYHQVLNIVGRRMRDNADANLRLVGCNADAGAEKGNMGLSRGRAERIREYLVKMWSIDSSRIRIEARGLPETVSNVKESEGEEENRRVDMYSNDIHIFEPILTNGITRISDPPTMRFKIATEAEKGITGWDLAMSQNGYFFNEFSGTDSIPATVDLLFNSAKGRVPNTSSPMGYQLTVRDGDGQVYASEKGSITVEQVTLQKKRQEGVADKEVDHYSIIGFDDGQSELNEQNKQVLKWIQQHITPKSTVKVKGYANWDESRFNRELSEKRAQGVADKLDTGNGKMQGMGENQLLFPTNIPEGRFYNRRVDIDVETPVR